MADTKVSALPAASTPLDGTETVPVVQGGVSEKASVADLRGLNTDYGTTTPAAPGAGGLLFTRHRARRLPAFIGPAGQDTVLQPALFSNRVGFWQAVWATAAFNNMALPVPTTNGTAAALVTPAFTNFFTSLQRVKYATAGTAGSVGGVRMAVAPYHFSTTANKGGFFTVMRVGLAAASAATRLFCGMTANTAALSNADHASGGFNLLGFGANGADTNWSFFHNGGSGTPTKVDLGASFPKNNTTNFYEFRIFAPSGAGASVYWSAHLLNDGTVVQGGPVTTPLPAVDLGLAVQLWMSNNTTAAIQSMDVQSVYVETDN